MPDADRSALVKALADFPGRLAGAARTARAAALADRQVVPGEWGRAEIVRHLIAVERDIWQARLAQLAREDDPRWAWVEPGLEPGLDGASLDEIVATFVAARAETVDTVMALDDAGWARFGTHATYGVLDIAGLLRIAVDHDREHLEAITAAG